MKKKDRKNIWNYLALYFNISITKKAIKIYTINKILNN